MLPPLKRVVTYHPTLDQGVVPWEEHDESSITKIVTTVAECSRLQGKTDRQIGLAVKAWFADPDLRLHWFREPSRGTKLVSSVSVDRDVEEHTLRVTFVDCQFTDDQLYLTRRSQDPY